MSRKIRPAGLIAAAGYLVLAGWRALLPERGLDATGPRALADAAFAVALTAMLVLLALALGRRALRMLGLLEDCGTVEATVFAFTLGAGGTAYGFLALALVGWLTTIPIVLGLTLTAFLLGSDLHAVVARLRQTASRGSIRSSGLTLLVWIGIAIGVAVFALAAGEALAPAWDYDGLVYHLQGPRLFLEAGRLLPLPELWQANGPQTVEMLYTAGLAFGSDSAARLVHLSMTAVLVVAAIAAGRRWLGASGGWLAGAVLLGIPILPMWGSLAFADVGWALFEFVSVLAFLRWWESDRRGWLVASGITLGFALGSKYLALEMLATLVVVTAWSSFRRAGWRRSLARSALLAGTAAIVASPWYLKNALWFGNPVYPLIFGGPGWPSSRVAALMSFNLSFGTGHTLGDILLLPWNLYARHEAFGSFLSSLEVPSLLFPFALLSPFLVRRPIVRTVELVALLRFGFWIFGSQPFRYLLPVFPLLSLLVAPVLLELHGRLGRRLLAFSLGTALVLGVLATTLIYQILFFFALRPAAAVLGFEPKDTFLSRNVGGYDALRYLENLPGVGEIYMAWDGQGYYCDDRCIVDAEQSQWAQLVRAAPSEGALTTALRERGVTHLLVNLDGMNFLLRHDPSGLHQAGADALLEEYGPACLKPLLETDSAVAYRLICE